MPTSNARSGKCLANVPTPVPSGMAAVIATILGSASASLISALANTEVYEGAAACFLNWAPVAVSNLTTPWYLSAEFSAGG